MIRRVAVYLGTHCKARRKRFLPTYSTGDTTVYLRTDAQAVYFRQRHLPRYLFSVSNLVCFSSLWTTGTSSTTDAALRPCAVLFLIRNTGPENGGPKKDETLENAGLENEGPNDGA